MLCCFVWNEHQPLGHIGCDCDPAGCRSAPGDEQRLPRFEGFDGLILIELNVLPFITVGHCDDAPVAERIGDHEILADTGQEDSTSSRVALRRGPRSRAPCGRKRARTCGRAMRMAGWGEGLQRTVLYSMFMGISWKDACICI